MATETATIENTDPEGQKLEARLRDEEALRKLGSAMRAKFAAYSSDRRETEDQWLRNLRQYLGKYDPDVPIDSDQSRAYPKITRVKVVSMVSRLMSLLFPADEANWSLEPSPVPALDEQRLQRMLEAWAARDPQAEVTQESLDKFLVDYAAERTRRLSEIITDQLNDVGDKDARDYSTLVRRVVASAVKFSMGVLKGPMTIETSERRVRIDPLTRLPTISQETRYRPYFEFVPVWDYYPDMSAKSFDQMDGQFQRHVFSKHQLLALAKRGDFDTKAIRDFIASNPDGNCTRQNHETQMSTLSNEKAPTVANKYEVLEWWGHVSGGDLAAAGVEVPEELHTAEVKATLWLLGESVIKAARDPFPDGARMYHQFIFEDDEVNLCGSGLPPIVRDSQLAVSTAARMLMDNAAVACGPQVEVDENLLAAGQDARVRPFQVWRKDEDAPPNSGNAVRELKFDAHIGELLQVVRTFKGLADEETFVGPMTGGDMANAPSEAMRTTGGASMLMGNAALPFRDIVRNFDAFTASVIYSLVKWNELFNVDEDIFGDVRPVPRGATSLIAKELRAFALDNLANTMTEDERLYIDMKALARHRLLVRDLPLNELMVSDEEAERREQAREQERQAQMQLQNQMLQEQIAGLRADAFKATTQGQKNLDAGQVAVFNAVAAALEKGIDPNAIVQFIEATTPAALPDPANPGGEAGDRVPGLAL
jgi:hypothetical protein